MKLYLISLGILFAALIIMGLWGVVSVIMPARNKRNRMANICGALLAATACGIGFIGVIIEPWQFSSPPQIFKLPWTLPFGRFEVALDCFSRIFLLPIFGLGFVCAISGKIALRHERAREHNLISHWFFYLQLLFGMALVVSAHDMLLFLLAWETMSLAPFFLIDFNDLDSKVRDASWVYLIAAHLGAVFLIAFFILLWQISGQTSLDPATLSQTLAGANPVFTNILFVLSLLGFGAKAGIAPLHVWLPDAHPVAPSHVSALLSGAMINTGLYGVLRSISLLGGVTVISDKIVLSMPTWWGWALLIIGILTSLLGILKALGQENLKRMLAYSSVENMGIMFMGAGVGLIGLASGKAWIFLPAFSGCLIHMLNHAGFKGLLFLCAGEILHSTGTLNLDLLGGLQKKLPLLGVLFAIGAASIACLPPLSGFIGEFGIYVAMANGVIIPEVELQLGLLFSMGLLALVSGLACALYVKAYGIIFLGQSRSEFANNIHPVRLSVLWPLLFPALACLAGGLFAPAFFNTGLESILSLMSIPQEFISSCLAVARQLNNSYWHIAFFGNIGIIFVLGLLLVAIFLPGSRRTVIRPTWSCGYQAGTCRIQYTSGSFSEPLTRIFGFITGISPLKNTNSDIFPKPLVLNISRRDWLRNSFYQSIFEYIERVCNFCKIIQHGKIHIYILYIIITVVCLLFWGLKQ